MAMTFALCMASAAASILLQGCSNTPGLRPDTTTTLTTTTVASTSKRTTTTTTSLTFPKDLPEYAEILPDSAMSLGSSWDFGRGTWLAYSTPQECSANATDSACSSWSAGEVTAEVLVQKIENWEDAKYLLTKDAAYHGHSPDYNFPVLFSQGVLNFVIAGWVPAAKRNRISNMPELKFSHSRPKDTLQANPEDFVRLYGRYVVSEIIYGARTICAFSFAPRNDGDGAYLRDLFANITSDVFFEASMSEEYVAKKDQAFSERGLTPSWDCVGAGPSPSLSPFSQPFELGSAFRAWTRKLPNQAYDGWHPLRAKVSSAADVKEVTETMQNLSSAEQKPVTSIQQITANTTFRLEIDLALAVFAQSSALRATDYECSRWNSTLRSELLKINSDVTSYQIKVHLLTAADMGNMQDEFSEGNYSWLQGEGIFQRFERLVEHCEAAARL